MSRPSTIEERPYAKGGEFGPEIEEEIVQFADGVTVPLSTWAASRLAVDYDPCWYGIGVPEWVEEARASAKAPATASGVQGFVAPSAKPIAEKALEKAIDTVGGALDLHMRSRREAPPLPEAAADSGRGPDGASAESSGPRLAGGEA